MAIQAGIFNSMVRPPEDPIANYMKLSQLRDMGLQRQRQQQEIKQGDMTLKNLGQQQGDDQALRDAYAKSGGDQNVLLSELGKTAPHLVPKVQEHLATTAAAQQKAKLEQNKLDAEGQLAQLKVGTQHFENVAQELSTAVDQPSYTAALQRLAARGTPGAAEMLQQHPQFDPAFVAQHVQGAIPVLEQLKAKQKELEIATTQRGQDMTSKTAANAQAVTVRGQNMVDARGRESNAVAAKTADLKQQEMQNTLNQQNTAKAGAAASYDTAISTLDRLEKHPGLSPAVGAGLQKTFTPFIGAISGTDRADFEAELDTFKAQTFLPMVQSLKGMGALSDAEGKKLSEAVGALSTNMSEKAFKDSIGRIRTDLQKAKARVGGAQPAASAGGQANEPSATAPNGHKIVLRNGAWVDAQTGQPIQ